MGCQDHEIDGSLLTAAAAITLDFRPSIAFAAGMAGDGGNDCGGLRAAHAGLALSDAEAWATGSASGQRVMQIGEFCEMTQKDFCIQIFSRKSQKKDSE